jgi:prepilin-type processing-associated H-X9-DG protein
MTRGSGPEEESSIDFKFQIFDFQFREKKKQVLLLRRYVMRCRQCGTENPETSQYCQQCGTPLTPVPLAAAAGAAKTSGLAKASFVMGLLCLTCIAWPFLFLPAIICGIIALVVISNNKGRLKGSGMAIAGIVIPVVLMILIPVLAMLLAILMPALNKARQLAQGVACSTNVKTIGTASMLYMEDYDGRFPTPEQWCDLLIKEANVSEQCLKCLNDEEGTFSYAVNKDIPRTDIRGAAGDLVLVFEADLGCNGVGGPEDAVFRHYAGNQPACNVLFADGHVELITQDRIEELRWKP